jgi:hypothetical protein
VCNEVARRKDLSARAKGIYYYVATLPSNWALTQQECMEHFTEGREAFRTAFKELIDKGYILQNKTKNEQGLLTGWEYEVLWTVGKPTHQETEIRFSGQSENPSLLNTDNTNYPLEEVIKEDISKDISKKKSVKFHPPTIEEVIFDFESRSKTKENAEKFFNYYESTDWHSGRSKIKNWKAAARNWRDDIFNIKPKEDEKPKLEYQKTKVSYNGYL